MNNKVNILLFFFLSFLIGIQCNRSNIDNTSIESSIRYLPEFNEPTYIYVINEDDMNGAEKVMITTLQGIVSRSRPEIYINDPDRGYGIWLDDLKDRFGVDYEYQIDPWWYIEKFRDHLNGYLLYEMGEASENVATTLSGIEGAVAIDVSLEDKIKTYGLNLHKDLRGKNEAWVFKEYNEKLRKDLLLFRRWTDHLGLREYASASGALIYYHNCKDPDALNWIEAMDAHTPVLGWAGNRDDCVMEHAFVEPFSQRNAYVLPGSGENLSVLSGMKVPGGLHQQGHTEPEYLEGVHYVTFVMSDGDNKGWILDSFSTDPKWFGNAHRGNFPMGWTISPSLVEMAPTVLDWFYTNASTGAGADVFIAGVSGTGYMYPDKYADLEGYAKKMNYYLEKSDLPVINLMIFEPNGYLTEVIQPLLSEASVLGCLAINYTLGYDLLGGKIIWAEGKPCIGGRYAMCNDCSITGKNPQEIASLINGLPKDPNTEDGYSFVIVQPWSYSLEDVESCIDALDSDVKVVTPEEMVKLVLHFRPNSPNIE